MRSGPTNELEVMKRNETTKLDDKMSEKSEKNPGKKYELS